MQIERLFSTTNITKKRRPSHFNINTVTPSEVILSTRTPKSIIKNRRSSLATEALGGTGLNNNSNTNSNTNNNTMNNNNNESNNNNNNNTINSKRNSFINVMYHHDNYEDFTFPSSPLSSLSSPLTSNHQHHHQREFSHPLDINMDYFDCSMNMDIDIVIEDTKANNNTNHEQHDLFTFNPSFSSPLSSITSSSSFGTSMNHNSINPLSMASSSLPSNRYHFSHHQNNNSTRRRSSVTSTHSMITSNLTSQSMGLPTFDVHTLFRIKKRRLSLSNINIDLLHMEKDISINSIKSDGLKAMLQSRIPLCYFLYHLLEEFSCENLFFLIDLEQYEKYEYISNVQQLTVAQHINDTYLSRNSPFEINLDDSVRSEVITAIEQRNINGCFDHAKRAAYLLLEYSFMQFIGTETWNEMIKTCGESTIYYNNDCKEKTINYLLGYLERMHSIIYTNPHTDAPVFMNSNQSSKKHYDMVKAMVHEFSRNLLGVEFEYYRIHPSTPTSPSFHTSAMTTTTIQEDPTQQQKRKNRRGFKNKHVVLFDFFGKKHQR
ncbi:unnamed protein product [Cunninghamella blakesleeana]